MKNVKMISIFLCIFFTSGLVLSFIPSILHKPLQLSVIEYIIKINSDNSITKTKKVTDYNLR